MAASGATAAPLGCRDFVLQSSDVPLRGKRLLVVGEHEELGQLVAGAASGLGASVVQCRGGRAALAEIDGTGAHAAIVDLPLADTRADAFLMALRDHGVRCVAVSGILRGARYAATAVRFGAERFFDKPFDVEEVLAVLAGALGGAEPSVPAPAPSPDPASGGTISTPSPPLTALATSSPDFLSAEAGEGSSEGARAPASNEIANLSLPPTSPPAGGEGAAWLAVSASDEIPADFDSIVFSEARPALDETSPGIPLVPLPPEGLAMPLPSPAVPVPRRRGAPALPEGDLASTRVPRLLAALYTAEATGALTLARGPFKKLVLFERGRPVFAVSNVPSERFAARCVREGVLSPEALDAVLTEIGPKVPLNEALVARGLLDDGCRVRMMGEQIREILWSTFAWSEGSYRLLHGPRARRPIARVELFPGDLVLEGIRRTASLESLRRDLPDALALAPAAGPVFELHQLAIAPGEASMLAQADGTKTVGDLVVLSALDERSALAFLQGCREVGVLDAVSRLLAGTRRIGFM